jgi:hypothetical protein
VSSLLPDGFPFDFSAFIPRSTRPGIENGCACFGEIILIAGHDGKSVVKRRCRDNEIRL